MRIKWQHLKNFYLLDGKTKIIFLQAISWISLMWVVVKCMPSKYLIKWVGKPILKSKKTDVFVLDDRYVFAKKIFSYACQFIDLNNSCLIYALAAKYYLKSLKLPINLYLGVKKEDSHFQFHAWLYCGQEKFVGCIGEDQYTVLAIFD